MFVFFSLIFVNAPVNAFCAGSRFLHQWFCIPSIPVAVHIFLFTDSFFTFSKVMLNSLTWLTYLIIFSIHGMFGVLSSLSQVPHQNSTNFSISCISLLCAFSLSKFLKNPFYSPWNITLFLASFSNFLHILPNLSFCTSICPTSAPLHFQVVISCIFFSQNYLFLGDLVFLLVDFLYFPDSPSLFSLRSDVIP